MILSIPASSADAKRGFNRLKMAKSDWRSKLSDAHLSEQMTIMLEGPSILQFGPMPVINLWSLTPRRERVQKDVVKPIIDNFVNTNLNQENVVTDEVESETQNEIEEEQEVRATARAIRDD